MERAIFAQNHFCFVYLIMNEKHRREQRHAFCMCLMPAVAAVNLWIKVNLQLADVGHVHSVHTGVANVCIILML